MIFPFETHIQTNDKMLMMLSHETLSGSQWFASAPTDW